MQCVICRKKEVECDPASYVDGVGQPCPECLNRGKQEEKGAKLEFCRNLLEFCKKGRWN